VKKVLFTPTKKTTVNNNETRNQEGNEVSNFLYGCGLNDEQVQKFMDDNISSISELVRLQDDDAKLYGISRLKLREIKEKAQESL